MTCVVAARAALNVQFMRVKLSRLVNDLRKFYCSKISCYTVYKVTLIVFAYCIRLYNKLHEGNGRNEGASMPMQSTRNSNHREALMSFCLP